MPAVAPLVMLIKAFLLQRGLNEPYSGGFGSYTVICLVISLLQVYYDTACILSPLTTSMQMHPKVRRREIKAEQNLGVLLLEFMELYGRIYNYNDVGISLRNGGSYFSPQERGWTDAVRMHIAIEDPMDSSEPHDSHVCCVLTFDKAMTSLARPLLAEYGTHSLLHSSPCPQVSAYGPERSVLDDRESTSISQITSIDRI